MSEENKVFNKNILIAIDESENATRAVSYVAQLLGGTEGFKVTVLHVIPDPEEDFFPNDEEKEKWLKNYTKKIDRILNEHREILIRGGFKPEAVKIRSELRYCPSMAECILAERDKTQYDTIVVGRQGLSRKEQFLFGSISSKIVNHANNCAVWVVA
jgi:nucleotide-binding universal stress UspA family protein